MGKFKDIDLTIKTIKLFPDLKKKLRKGTISTIESPAKKFVDIRTRVKKAGGYAMGGEASEGVARGKILKDMKARDRKRLMDSLERLEAKSKKKSRRPSLTPKRPKGQPKQMERPKLEKPFAIPPMVRPKLEKPFKKPKMKRAK